MDHDLNALLIFEDMDEPGSIYGCLLVEKDRLSEAWEIAIHTYKTWSAGDCAISDVFEAIFNELDKAGIPYKSIEDWDTFGL